MASRPRGGRGCRIRGSGCGGAGEVVAAFLTVGAVGGDGFVHEPFAAEEEVEAEGGIKRIADQIQKVVIVLPPEPNELV